MKNYFSKTALAFLIAFFIYLSLNSGLLIKDQAARTAIFTFTVLFCTVIYAYYTSNFNRFGNE